MNENKLFGLVLGVWGIGVLLWLAFWAAVLYIVLHFVLKWW